MDCREFRAKHAPYVDLLCSSVEENEMRAHVRDCLKCARHDMVIRRSLLLFRNLPVIQPSEHFQTRLEARLRALGGRASFTAPPVRFRPSYRTFAALAAGLGFVTFLAASMVLRAPEPLQMTPVVATLPALEPAHMATPTFVATIPTGMSVWPAIMAASQAQMHFVAAELANER